MEAAKVLKRGTIKRIHVNQHVVRRCWAKGDISQPAITIQTSKGSLPARHVEINGKSIVVSSPDKPLSCGARIWIETTAEVKYE